MYSTVGDERPEWLNILHLEGHTMKVGNAASPFKFEHSFSALVELPLILPFFLAACYVPFQAKMEEEETQLEEVAVFP